MNKSVPMDLQVCFIQINLCAECSIQHIPVNSENPILEWENATYSFYFS